jgi:hypothetical protein
MYIFEYKLQLLDIMKIFEIMKLEYFNKIWMIIMDIVPDWAQVGPTSSTTQSTGTSRTTQKGQVHLADSANVFTTCSFSRRGHVATKPIHFPKSRNGSQDDRHKGGLSPHTCGNPGSHS